MANEGFREVLTAAEQIGKLTKEWNRNQEQILAASERLMAPMRAAIAASHASAVKAALNLPTFDFSNFANLGLTAQMTTLQQPITAILEANTQNIVASTSLLQLGENFTGSIRSLSLDLPTIDPGFIANLRGEARRTLTYLPDAEREPVADALTTLESFEVGLPADAEDIQPVEVDWVKIAAVCVVIRFVLFVLESQQAEAVMRYLTGLLVALLGHPTPSM